MKENKTMKIINVEETEREVNINTNFARFDHVEGHCQECNTVYKIASRWERFKHALVCKYRRRFVKQITKHIKWCLVFFHLLETRKKNTKLN